MKPVTDPELLKLLNAEAAAPAGLKPVTDPLLLKSLDGGEAPKENAFKAAGRKDPVRAVTSTLQGPAMNWADEGLAAVQGGIDRVFKGIPFDQARQQWRDYYRGGVEQFQSDNPVLAPALQVGASLATGMGARDLLMRGGMTVPTVASAINPTTALGRVGTAALAGAGAGAVGGAGSAETMADVPLEATKGAALGGITGGAVNAIGQGAGAVGQNVVARGANSRIIQDRIREGGAGAGAAQRVVDWADDLAKRRLAVALARDESTPEKVAARLRKLDPNEARLADAAGENTRGLLDTVAIAPGRTTNRVEMAIRQRQAGRPDRLMDVVEQGLGTGGARLSPTLAALDESRRAAAAPLYRQLDDVSIEVDGELAELLKRAKSAFGDAQKIAAVNGQKFELPEALKAIEQGAGQTRRSLGVPVEGPGAPSVNFRQLDTLKRSLFDIEDANINPETGRLNEFGNAVKNLRRALVDKVDAATVNPQTGQSIYAAARAAYAGPTELRIAANLGTQAMSKDAWKIRELTDGMSESELEAFRVGAAEALRKKIGTEAGQTSLLKMWKEPATQDKLRELFPDVRTYREFAARVAGEARLKPFEAVGRGSATASRQSRQENEGAAMLQGMADLGSAAAGRSPLSLIPAVRALYGRTVMPEPVRDRIGSLLMTPSPQVPGLLGDLSRYVAQEDARRAAAAARTGLLGGVTINSLLAQ